MWMPETEDVGGGMQEIAGTVCSAVEHQVPQPSGFFAARGQDVWLFRLREDGSQRTVNCRFEGPMNAMLSPGDHIWVLGSTSGGVLLATRIRDDSGALLGQAACFVATAVFEDASAPEVNSLRVFRDVVLARSNLGGVLIRLYWHLGPWAARLVANRRRCKPILRSGLRIASRIADRISQRYSDCAGTHQQKGENHGQHRRTE